MKNKSLLKTKQLFKHKHLMRSDYKFYRDLLSIKMF